MWVLTRRNMMKFIIYKGKLYCTKDGFDFVKSINVDNKKLEYFKKELLKILDKQEIVSKSFSDMFDFIEKGILANIGEVRTWNGVKYKKIAPGKWRKFITSNKGAGLAIASLKKEIDKCNDSQELLDLVLLHKERFYDNNGNPYPVVQELSDYVSKINDKLEKLDSNSVNKKNQSFNSVEAVKDFYKGTDNWLKAPNGKDTKLSEKQWCEVRTEQFKNWFGDWEKNKKGSSKILDENGEPLINYHGTSYQFDEFVSDEIGKTTNNKGIFGNGFYFSNSKEMANYYTKFDKTKEGKVLNTYLNIKKPFIWSAPENVEVARKLGFPKDRIRDNKLLPLNDNEKIMKFTKKLKDAGYDGVIFNYPKNFSGYGDNNVNETVAFYPNQIKSANENDGNFSFNNNSINKSFSEMLNILLSHYDFLGGK